MRYREIPYSRTLLVPFNYGYLFRLYYNIYIYIFYLYYISIYNISSYIRGRRRV